MIILKQVTELEEKLRVLKNNIENHINEELSLVECEECGCLLNKGRAIKGKVEVRTRERYGFYGGMFKEDYLYYPYYCKIHTPKVKK